MDKIPSIISTTCQTFPTVQAIYLFGSYGTADEWPESDADIALLLPPALAKTVDWETLAGLQARLEELLGKDVDLINLRRVNTVLQKEVVMADRRIFRADEQAADEFEMLALSFYQELTAERREIVAAARRGARLYPI